jgi:hypothetical protein
MLRIAGLLKASIEQYYNPPILLAADNPAGALFDTNQSREAEGVVETIESERIKILLDQLLFGVRLGQADTDYNGAYEGISLVIDTLRETTPHDRETELPVRLEKPGKELLLCAFVEFTFLYQTIDLRITRTETGVNLLHEIVG